MYIELLRDRYTAHDCQFARVMNVDLSAARMRTMYHLAETICHEVCHGLDSMWTARPPRDRTEPFCGDDRIAEVGFS